MLAVAQEAFTTDGLAVAMPEIARRAGVGVGTIYRQFPTKEALFEAIVRHSTEAMVERARAMLVADDPGVAFFTFVAEATEEGASNSAFKDALAGTGYDLRTAEATAAARQAIGALLERAQQAGQVRADVTVADLFALISGVLSATGIAGTRADGQVVNRLVSVVCDGLRAPAR